MADVTYPYDPNGNSPANLVTNEQQVLSQVNGDPYRYFIPNFAPFYQTNFSIKAKNALGSYYNLTPGVDFEFSMKYIGASRANGMMIFGAISIINKNVNGPVLVTYQCLGGQYSANRNYVIQTIAQNNYNPRRIAWDQVTNVPEVFPPSSHPQDLDTFTGFRDLIDAVDRIAVASANTDTLRNELRQHTLNVNDPHKTLQRLPSDLVRRPELEAHTKDYNDPHRTRNLLPANIVGRAELDQALADMGTFFDTVPLSYRQQVITVKNPHMRVMVWDTATGAYIRAPWHQPGMLQYSYHNPSAILGFLPVRADRSYPQANYPDLVKVLGLSGMGTFTLVEMRGEFLRVLDNSRGVDVGRLNLSYQADSLENHNHFLPTSTGNSGQGWALLDHTGDPNTTIWYQTGLNANPSGTSSITATTGSYPPGIAVEGGNTPGNVGKYAAETRPRNVAVPLWISI